MMMVMMYAVKVHGKGKGHLIWRLFMRPPHHRSAQVWHTLSRDCKVSLATHVFIHECRKQYLPLLLLMMIMMVVVAVMATLQLLCCH